MQREFCLARQTNAGRRRQEKGGERDCKLFFVESAETRDGYGVRLADRSLCFFTHTVGLEVKVTRRTGVRHGHHLKIRETTLRLRQSYRRLLRILVEYSTIDSEADTLGSVLCSPLLWRQEAPKIPCHARAEKKTEIFVKLLLYRPAFVTDGHPASSSRARETRDDTTMGCPISVSCTHLVTVQAFSKPNALPSSSL